MAKRTYEIEFLGSDEVIKKQAQLTLELRKTNEAIKEAKKSGNDKLYGELLENQIRLKEQLKITNQELRNQKKEFENNKLPQDSVKALESSYSKLTRTIKTLSSEQRKSDYGQVLQKEALVVKKVINETSQSFGDNSKNIGNYTESIRKALDNPLKFLKSAGVVGILATASTAFFRFGQTALEAYEKTEQGDKKLKPLMQGFERLRTVGKDFVFSVIEKLAPLIESALPVVENFLIKFLATFVAIKAGGVAFATNFKNEITKVGNDIELFFLKTKKTLGFGTEETNRKIAAITEENKKLAASHIDVFKTANDAYNLQIDKSKKAADSAKYLSERDKERAKEYKEAAEARKKELEEFLKYVEKLNDSIDTQIGKDQINFKKEQDKKFDSLLKEYEKEYELRVKANEKLKDLQEKAKEYDRPTAPREFDKIPIQDNLDKETDFTIDLIKKNAKKIALERKKAKQAEQDKDPEIIIQNAEDKIEKFKQDIQNLAVELKLIALDTIADVLITNITKEQKENEKAADKKIELLEEEYDKRRDFAQGNAELIKSIDREQAEEKQKIEIDLAKKSQEVNIKKAIIEGALAIAKTFAQVGFLAGLPLAALQAAITAKQIAVIKSQGFAEGGQPGDNYYTDRSASNYITNRKDIHIGTGYVKGAGTETSDSIPAFLSNKEYVLNAKMVKILGLEFLERLRRSTLGYSKYLSHPARKYATGGAVGGTTFVPNVNLPPSSQPIQTTAVFDRENIIAFGESVAGIIADEVQNALAKGLYDANSRLQREQRQKQRSAA